MTDFKVFDPEALKVYECVFKHLCAVHELGLEYVTTTISPQLADVEGDASDLLAKLIHVSSVTGDVEELLEAFVEQFLLKDVATATKQMRVNKEDITRLIRQCEHLVCAEEHFADFIKKYTGELQKANSDEEANVIRQKIVKLNDFLETTRLIRKKHLTGFLQKLEEKIVEEASDFKENV